MKLSLSIIFIICIIFKVTSGHTAANPITDIISDHQANGNSHTKYKSIVDKSTEEQNVAKYYKLKDLFSNPKANEIVLIRGKLLQNLDNNDLFVFQDSNTVANITVPANLWTAINEETYILNKDLQFLAKVIINSSNNSVTLQAIKVFHKISDTDNYILTQEDKKAIEQLDNNEEKKLSKRTIADTSESKEEEDFDSIDDKQNKNSNNLYGVPQEKPSEEEKSTMIEDKTPTSSNTKSESATNTDATNNATKTITEPEPNINTTLPEDKPAEEKESTEVSNLPDEHDEQPEEEIKQEEPEPEIYNKVPEEEHLKSKELENEDNNVLSPEEIQKLEQYDKNPPSERRRKSFFSFGK